MTINLRERIRVMDENIKKPNVSIENYKKFHYCEIFSKHHLYGPAIDECFEDIDGYLFVCNGEYGSQVNFCPICGYKAKKFIKKPEELNSENDKSNATLPCGYEEGNEPKFTF